MRYLPFLLFATTVIAQSQSGNFTISGNSSVTTPVASASVNVFTNAQGGGYFPASFTMTANANVPVGSGNVVFLYAPYSVTVPTIADAAGNTYQLDNESTNASDGLSVFIYSSRVTSQLNAGQNITVTIPNSTGDWWGYSIILSTIKSSAWFDGFATNEVGAATSGTGGSFNAAGGAEVVFGMFAHNPAGVPAANSGSYTVLATRNTYNGQRAGSVCYRILSPGTAAGAQNAAINFAASTAYLGVTAVYKTQ